jgi:uncharacterized membrane protein YdbT with pleckstrin-like domain
LGNGERVVALGRFHWWYSLKAWLALIAPLILLIAANNQSDPVQARWLTIGSLILLVLGAVIFLRLMIRKWTTEIGITSHRFVKKTGFISLHTDEMALPNIEGVRLSQSIFGRILGFGHLRIEGTGDDAFDLPEIADPVGFRRAIETAKGVDRTNPP